jgi:DNA-binding LacI/PurR family transcriptional regulator
MNNKARPARRNIADQLGIHAAMVSRALRGDTRITDAVRQKVRKAARKRGYKREAKLGELMKHLRSSEQRSYQGTLAWITNIDPADADMKAMIDQFLPHAVKRAEQLGYKLTSSHGGGAAAALRNRLALQARAKALARRQWKWCRRW